MIAHEPKPLVDDMLRLIEIRITAIWTWGHKFVAEKLNPARVRRKSEIQPLAAASRLGIGHVARHHVSAETSAHQSKPLTICAPRSAIPANAFR
jgi:hypothetical protein